MYRPTSFHSQIYQHLEKSVTKKLANKFDNCQPMMEQLKTREYSTDIPNETTSKTKLEYNRGLHQRVTI